MTEQFEQFIKAGRYLKGWSSKTERSYRQAFTSFQQSLSTPTSCEEKPNKALLEAWVIWMRQKGMAPGGINCYIRAMNSFLSWLKDEGHIQEPLKVRLLPNHPKPLKGFSDVEVRSLLSFRPRGFYDLRTFTLTVLLLDSGCRIDEALTLDIENVNMDNLQLTVTGKGGKKRVVPISFEFRKILFRYTQHRIKAIQGVSSVVFCSREGGHLSYRNVYRDIKWLCAKAGVSGEHVHPHAFRHAFACTYIRRGGDIYRLSRILGHTSISTTQIYLRSMGIEQVAENHSSLSPLSRYP